MSSTNLLTVSSAATPRKNVTRKKKYRGTRPSTTSASRITPEGVDRYVHYVYIKTVLHWREDLAVIIFCFVIPTLRAYRVDGIDYIINSVGGSVL